MADISLIKTITFDIQKISESLLITSENVCTIFSDGRSCSRFNEDWASKLYTFEKCESSNNYGFDGWFFHPLLGKQSVSIRSLTKSGVKFQLSKYIGSGRKCDVEDLIKSLRACDFEIVVDICQFPVVQFCPVTSHELLEFVKNGKLGIGGWRQKQFYNLLLREDP